MSGGQPLRNQGLGLTIPRVDTDMISALCAVNRQLAQRIDELIDITKRVARGEPIPDGPVIMPGARENVADLLRILLASMPRDHQVVTVGTAPTWMAENKSGLDVPVLVTNYDHAQQLRYGTATLTDTSGPVIDPESTEKIVIPPNQTLYGLVPTATISVAVSTRFLPR